MNCLICLGEAISKVCFISMGVLDMQQWNVPFWALNLGRIEESHITATHELARSVNYLIALLVRKV